MNRLIITFETLFQVLAADKFLRQHLAVRPTPTPPGLASDICGVSLEILDASKRGQAEELLKTAGLPPRGIHEVSCGAP